MRKKNLFVGVWLVGLFVFAFILLATPLVSADETVCYDSVGDLPLSCDGYLVNSDSFDGSCRSIDCAGQRVLACDKGDSFEMYNQGNVGAGSVDVCLGDTCLSSGSGFVRSEDFCVDEPVDNFFVGDHTVSSVDSVLSFNGGVNNPSDVLVDDGSFASLLFTNSTVAFSICVDEPVGQDYFGLGLVVDASMQEDRSLCAINGVCKPVPNNLSFVFVSNGVVSDSRLVSLNPIGEEFADYFVGGSSDVWGLDLSSVDLCEDFFVVVTNSRGGFSYPVSELDSLDVVIFHDGVIGIPPIDDPPVNDSVDLPPDTADLILCEERVGLLESEVDGLEQQISDLEGENVALEAENAFFGGLLQQIFDLLSPHFS